MFRHITANVFHIYAHDGSSTMDSFEYVIICMSNFEFLVCKVIFARSQYIQLDNCSQTYWWVQTYAEFIFAILCFLFDMATFYKLVRINRAKKSENDHVESQRRLLERLFLIQVFDPTFHNNILFWEHRRLGLFCHHVHSEHDICVRLWLWSLALYFWWK
jgi:hypothetical protein